MTGRTFLRNAVDVALNGAIDQTATEIVVDDATDLPDNVPFYIVIDPFNDAGREYVRVGAIDKPSNTLSSLDRNLEGTQSLVHADASVVRLTWQSQHLDDAWEDQVGIYSRGRWRSVWVESTYEKNDMVVDGNFLAIANKQTTDPAAPTPVGNPRWLLSDTPTWVPRSHTDYVLTGVRVQLTEADDLFVSTEVRAWVANVSADFRYTIFIEDNLTGVTTEIVSFSGNVLAAPGWFEFTIPQEVIRFGDDFVMWLLTQNTAATTTFTYPWVYTGTSQNDTDPGAGNWNTNNQSTTFRINSLDDNGVDRTADLTNVTPGTIIRATDQLDPLTWAEFVVTAGLGDLGGWFQFYVGVEGVGPNGAPTAADLTDIQFTIPVAAPVDYVELTDEYLNDPKISGVLQLGDGAEVFNENAYGIDFEFQQYTTSPDWDLMSTSSAGSGGSAGGGGLTQPQADVLYLRLDAGNSPATGKPTFAAGLVLGADLEAGGFRLTGLAIPPTADGEATPKKYVDDQDAAHVADGDPHPQYLTPAEADAGYLKLDASNDPITGALDVNGLLTVFDSSLVLHDSNLNLFLDLNAQGNIQLNGQNRIALEQTNARLKFLGQTGLTIGHLYDDKTNDLPGSLLGSWYFTAAAITLLGTGNSVVFTTDIDVAALFPAGASQVPELLVVTDGFLRQNNQPGTAFQGRTEIAGTSRNYAYAVGAANVVNARSSVPLPNTVRVTAGAAAVTVSVWARAFAADVTADLDLHVRIYAAPIGGNV